MSMRKVIEVSKDIAMIVFAIMLFCSLCFFGEVFVQGIQHFTTPRFQTPGVGTFLVVVLIILIGNQKSTEKRLLRIVKTTGK